MINVAQKKSLHEVADDAHGQKAQQNSKPEINSPQAIEGKSEIGPQHEEASMGKVEDSQDTEDDSQAGSQEPQVHGQAQAYQPLES